MASMRRLAGIVAVAAVSVLAAGGATSPATGAAARPADAPAPPLAVLWQAPPRPNLLARIDPVSLRPVDDRRVPLRSAAGWAFAPGGDRIVFASHESTIATNFPRAWLRLVDPVALRRLGDVALGGGWVGALAWLAPRRIVVLQQTLATEPSVVVVDPVARRVVSRAGLDGWALETRRTAHELVVLLAPAGQAIAPVRLARVDNEGRIQVVELERILGGAEPTERGTDVHAMRQRHPGLAVDALGRRAYVVGDTGLVAEVALDSLAVGYHVPKQAESWLSRLRAWLEPTAQAKMLDGTIRHARWLGDGLLATAGTNHTLLRDANGVEHPRTDPAGVHVIDVRTWRRRTIDASAAYVTFAGGLIFASGFRPDWIEESRASGVVVYEPDGDLVLRLFEGRVANVGEVWSGRASFWVGERVAIVDLASGRVLATRRHVPRLVRETSWLDG